MNKLAITLVTTTLAMFLASPTWAKGGATHGTDNTNAATRAIPANGTSDKATPAMPGNTRAQGEVMENREEAAENRQHNGAHDADDDSKNKKHRHSGKHKAIGHKDTDKDNDHDAR